MDSLDLDILTFLSERGNYEEYSDVVHKGLCTKLSWRLVQDFGEYYDKHPDATVIDNDFTLWFRVSKHPKMKPEEAETYGTIVTTIENRRATTPNTDGFIHTLKEASIKGRIKSTSDSLLEGALSFDEFFTEIHGLEQCTDSKSSSNNVVELSLEDLSKDSRDSSGYYWRLEDLNKAIGPVKQGDLIIVAKRPEVGGTSFLASELTYMFEQMGDKDAVIFNNEEAPDKVYTRLLSAALNVDYRTLISNPTKYSKDYEAFLDGRRIDIIHNTQMQASDIRRALDRRDYGFCGVNVILKVGVPGKLEDHDKLQYIGEELRRVATEYCPVMGITQADPTAEGVKYIHQDRIYKSKTALQGEADVLIMIGRDYDSPDDVRYFHVAKNKIPPAACCDLSCKHIMTEVRFQQDTGRFETLLFTGGNSRWKKLPTSTST